MGRQRVRGADSIAERQGDMAEVFPRRQFAFLQDCTGLDVHFGFIFFKNISLKNIVLLHVAFVLYAYLVHEAKCRGLGMAFCLL